MTEPSKHRQKRHNNRRRIIVVTRASSSSYLNHSLSIVTESGFKVIFMRPGGQSPIFRNAVALRVEHFIKWVEGPSKGREELASVGDNSRYIRELSSP